MDQKSLGRGRTLCMFLILVALGQNRSDSLSVPIATLCYVIDHESVLRPLQLPLQQARWLLQPTYLHYLHLPIFLCFQNTAILSQTCPNKFPQDHHSHPTYHTSPALSFASRNSKVAPTSPLGNGIISSIGQEQRPPLVYHTLKVTPHRSLNATPDRDNYNRNYIHTEKSLPHP